MINDCHKRTYDAGRSVTVAQPKPKCAGLLQICCKSMARINPQYFHINNSDNILVHQNIIDFISTWPLKKFNNSAHCWENLYTFGKRVWGQHVDYPKPPLCFLEFNLLLQQNRYIFAIINTKQKGNVIQRNCIHDITNMGADAAIRMDGNVRGTLVRENIIYNCAIPAINTRDKNNYIENNIMVDVSSRRKIRQRGYFMFGPEGTGRFVRNILYQSGKRRPFLLRLEGAKLNQFKADYNLFYSTGNPRISTAFLRKLQKDDSDEHSISADPLFVDMENEDFRLKPNSPMFERGFKQIDTSRIGLLPEFLQRWRDK